ncbi:MAG: ribosomal protein [Bacteroidota bacterium]|jgi:predicted flap endonuclease-1-like 5' DNA nuclease
MNNLLQDDTFFWLLWTVFTAAGILLGWTLRASTTEKRVRFSLRQIEQEKNTLARLYTHIKHQHDLREADFKRVSLELSHLQLYIQQLEEEKATVIPEGPDLAARTEIAEERAARLTEKLEALDALTDTLRIRNTDLNIQLEKAREELAEWDNFYNDYRSMQQRLTEYERMSRTLEMERDLLAERLLAAKSEADALQRELVRVTALTEKNTARTRRGGRALPENTDDLKVIRGITPVAEQKLLSLGVFTFEQISQWDDDAVIAFARALGMSPGKLFQEDWVGQARYLTGTVK